jgi:hypothetical protein
VTAWLTRNFCLISGRGSRFSLLSVETCSETHPAPYLMGMGGGISQGVRLAIHFHLVPRLTLH